MRVPCTCPVCQTPCVANLRDDLQGEAICPSGHRSLAIWQFNKFHALLDSALIAYLSGFRFEAVAALAAGLERFNEWYLRVMWRKHFREGTNHDRLWKLMAKQSERQLGAVYVAQALERGEVLEVPDAEFRNKVIHKGHLPSTDEVLKYGRAVFGYVVKLRTEAYDGADEWAADETERTIPSANDLPVASMFAPASAAEDVTFDTALRYAKHLLPRLIVQIPFDEPVPGETVN